MSMQTGVWHDLATIAGIPINQQTHAFALPASIFPAKSRIALIGTVGAGKSAVVGGVGITAETLVRETEHSVNPFYCRVIEGSSEIHQDKSDLRAGHFPKKTQAYTGFASEAGLLLEWEKKIDLGFGKSQTLWHKYLQVPICDLAGEDIEQTIRQVAVKSDIGEYSRQKVRNLIAYMQESDGFIVTLKGTRAQGFSRQLEPEKDPHVSRDPDVNMVRLLDALMQYKMNNPSSRPIRGVAVVLTACDELQRELGDEIGFNLLDSNVGQQDLQDFIAACFPATYSAIISLRVPNVKFFPSFFEVETDSQGNIQYWPEDPDSKKIKVREVKKFTEDWRHNLRKISYSEKTYIELINWLRNFAASA